jgi:TIR domain
VFISHAGPQKAFFAAWLQRELRCHGVSAFLDETSLRLGDAADVDMEAALRSCSIVVAVLTPAFLRSSYCMDELHWALHPKESHPALQQIYSSLGANEVADDVVRAAAQLPQPGEPCTVQRAGSRLPTLMPVFHDTSDIASLQDQLTAQIKAAVAASAAAAASADPADPAAVAAASAAAKAEQAGKDLAAACRRTGDRLDSHGK